MAGNQTSLITRILAMAKQTFGRVPDKSVKNGKRRKRVFEGADIANRMDELKAAMNSLKAEDLGLDRSAALRPRSSFEEKPSLKKMGDSGGVQRVIDYRSEKGQLTYIGVYEDLDVSVGVFIINSHGKIPLHNHPNMHGVLKILRGKLKIRSYDKLAQNVANSLDLPHLLRSRLELLERGYVVPTLMRSAELDAASPAVTLTPDRGNFHEIINESEEPAAFLDILAPPYNFEEEGLEDGEVRECDFYKVVTFSPAGGGRQDVTWLQLIPTPADYYCNSEPYMGPGLS